MEMETYLRFALALSFVLALIVAASWVMRRLGYGAMMPARTGKARRLGVVEVAQIDPRRRLVLVRRDGVEHLVLLGINNDLVLETGIDPPPDSGRRPPGEPRHDMSLERTRRNLLALASAIAPLAGLIVWLIADPASAQSFNLDLNRAGGSSTSQIIQLFALLTVLSIAPGILVMVTAFIRIAVVLSFLRTAMGIQQTPPNSVMMSLALFLTAFIMAPTMQEAYTNGIAPLVANEIDEMEAFEQSVKPFHAFMMQHVREPDLILFADIAKVGEVKSPEDTPLQVLIPAFMISELRRGFEIGFLLFLPFLIIDMVVASILMSMGMMMLPPAAVAMPFKIIFFVLVDGWHLISGTLVQSFGGIS